MKRRIKTYKMKKQREKQRERERVRERVREREYEREKASYLTILTSDVQDAKQLRPQIRVSNKLCIANKPHQECDDMLQTGDLSKLLHLQESVEKTRCSDEENQKEAKVHNDNHENHNSHTHTHTHTPHEFGVNLPERFEQA